MSEKLFSFSELVGNAADLQNRLTSRGVSSLIGGGVGLDLLCINYLPDFVPRAHKDIDLYVPEPQKKSISHFDGLPRLDFIPFWWLSKSFHKSTFFKNIPLDLFFLKEETPENLMAVEVSAAAILFEPVASIKYAHVDVVPDIIEYQGQHLKVFSPSSFQSISKAFSIGGFQDRQKLGQILSRIND